MTITTRMDDLEQLIGEKLPRDNTRLSELLHYVKCELAGTSRTEPIRDESELQIENKDTNRPDTWSPEGIARALKGIRDYETGIKRYKLSKKGVVEIRVDKRLREIRPFIACVVALHPRINDTVIRGLIQLQEKLDQSYGRRRRRSSIGFYDFDLITPPLKYGVADRDEVRFTPLQGSEPLSLREILERHPKGIEYGHIVSGYEKLPILLDSRRNVLSFPPIINSNDLGRVTPETKNILVEVTGTSERTVMDALTILTTALADRDAEIMPALVRYPYGRARKVTTPNLNERRIEIPLRMATKLTGMRLTRRQITSLLRRARYDVAGFRDGRVSVRIPCYRMDIMHPVDVVEDIAIAYGLNNMSPRWPSDPTIGCLSPLEEFSDTVRELMTGLGFQEILSFMMTNQEKLFVKMNQKPTSVVEVSNPKIATITCMRSWLLPSLMDFLANNTHVEYPQRIHEVADCTVWDTSSPNRTRDIRKVACVSAHSKANFTEMKSSLEPLMINLGFEFSLKPDSNPTFLDGRLGTILIGDQEVGVIGEIHPQVLENWKVEEPAAAMELDLNQLSKMRPTY